MSVKETRIDGAKLLKLSRQVDPRGSLMRLCCVATLEAVGLAKDFVQANVAETRAAGTLRVLHFQIGSVAEDRLIRCPRGAVFEVVVDLGSDSTSYLQWYEIELSAGDDRLLFAPRGCAHGYQTLRDNSELEYFITSSYSPDHKRDIHWNDRSFATGWPDTNPIVSNKDNDWPGFGS